MQYTDRQLWAIDRITHWWRALSSAYNDALIMNTPVVLFSNKMTSVAGLATRNTIKLSNHFLHQESCESFDSTLGHEAAHVFVNHLYMQRCKHDWRWREAMRRIGLPAKRCHQYKGNPRNPYHFLHVCVCGNRIPITPLRMNRLVKGTVYFCRRCKHHVPPTGHFELITMQETA